MAKWRCLLCNFEYDEQKGLPQAGILPGTPWEAVPDHWKCPNCGAGKNDFIMVKQTDG